MMSTAIVSTKCQGPELGGSPSMPRRTIYTSAPAEYLNSIAYCCCHFVGSPRRRQSSGHLSGCHLSATGRDPAVMTSIRNAQSIIHIDTLYPTSFVAGECYPTEIAPATCTGTCETPLEQHQRHGVKQDVLKHSKPVICGFQAVLRR